MAGGERHIETLVQLALADTGQEAVYLLATVCGLDPLNANWMALLVRALANAGRPRTALAVARAALARFPLHTGVRLQYWAVCEQQLPAAERLAVVRQWLPQVASGTELTAVLKLLPASQGEHRWGVVEYHAPTQELRGWALNLQHPHTAAALLVRTAQGRAVVQANRPHPLLAQAGLSAQAGGFQVRLPGPEPTLSVCFQDGPELLGSPLAASDGVRAVFTGFSEGSGASPLAQGEPCPAGPLGAQASAANDAVPGARPPDAPVDVLIPVYKGYQATLACVHSVLQAQALNGTAHQVVVLDDACPEPRLSAALQALGTQGRIQYVRHEANLGFIRTMNRGMALHPPRDVVWLNADTQVHGNWLDRLQQAAYAQAHTASATPFSNNGELMGFPEPRVAAPMPSAQELARLDAAAARLDADPVPLPTGCGFCFYLKRAALNAVGWLDEAHLQRGYGEETDWCLRARQAGWQHVGAPTVFVAHAGGVSFGAEKALRVAQNNALLRVRFPYAERDYSAFLARNPLAPLRATLAQALAKGAHAKTAAKKAQAPAPRVPRRPALKAACSAWLMLDNAFTLELGQAWLELARALARRVMAGEAAARVLTLQPGAWQTQWAATG